MATKVKLIADNVITTDQIDLTSISTTNISEGDNLYYTDARVDSRLSSGSVATISTSGNVTVGGNLTVNGSTTTINSTTLTVDDLNIVLASGAADAAAADGAGITVDGASASLTYSSSLDAFVFNKDVDIDGGTIDGADITVGSGKTLDVSGGTFTVANDQISGDAINGGTATPTTLTSTTVNATTVDTTNIELTNLKAKDGTAAGSIADSTGVVTIASSGLTTTDINGGTIDGVTIGGSSAGAGTFTTVTANNAEIGTRGASDANAFIDLTGDTTYTDFGFRIIRNSGANGRTDLRHRGTGNFVIEAVEAAAITFETTDTERMHIDSSGNVGIGNSNPSAFNSLSATDKLVIGDSTVSNLTLFGTQYGSLAFADSDTSGSTAQYAGLIQYYHTDNSMQFYTGSTERMRIDSGGNFAIANGNQTANTVSSRVMFGNKGYFTSSDIGRAEICGVSEGSLWYNGTALSFLTNPGPDVTSRGPDERMRITSAGNVGIGTSSPGAKLDVNGEVFISPNTAGKNTFQLTTNASNDARLKMLSDTTQTVDIQANGDSYFNGGNVGIGTSSPGAKLDVRGSAVFNEDSGDNDFRVESDGNTHALFVNAGANNVSIGTSTAGPSSGLYVEGTTNLKGGIASNTLIAGYVATNYTGTRYWILHKIQDNGTTAATAWNCIGYVHASSYTTWNVSEVLIRRDYASTTVTATITGKIKSGVDVSVVDVSLSSDNCRYIAIKFTGGDPGIEANLVGYNMNAEYLNNGSTARFVTGTTGVTENSVIATY